MPIFKTRRDHGEFLDCFGRHLSRERRLDSHWRPYRKLHDEVSVLAYGLMGNHFHFLIHQHAAGGMRSLMRSGLIGYGKYFNSRYNRDGPVFKSRYQARPVESIEHLRRVIAYIHLNDPTEQLNHEFTSHPLYLRNDISNWVNLDLGLKIFGNVDDYVHALNRHGPSIIERKLRKRGIEDPALGYRPLMTLRRLEPRATNANPASPETTQLRESRRGR